MALLLAAASPTAIDAEREFAADAQKLGQWSAFRKWSTPDAVMFAPQPVKAHEFLKDRKEPPQAVIWWPGRSYVACDESIAVNTGPWIIGWGKSVGYFTTVWTRQPDGGWKWIYDGGDSLNTARAEGGDIQPVQASCDGQPTNPPSLRAQDGYRQDSGRSADGTLHWQWAVGPKGDRTFRAYLWDGARFQMVVHDQVAAPQE